MKYMTDRWNDLQGQAASLIASKGRLRQDLIELRRFKHHLTGAQLDANQKVSRMSEIADTEKQLANIETGLELVQAQIQDLVKSRKR